MKRKRTKRVRRMSKAWKFEELPPNSKKGCGVEGCKKYADYLAVLHKKDGLFKFTLPVCAFHKLLVHGGRSK